MSCELHGEGRRSILSTKLAATARYLEGSKMTSDRSSTYCREARFCSCGDIGLTEINEKYILKTRAKHKPYSSALRAEGVG